MSEHKCCWHETSRSEGTAGTTIVKQCCHCGVIEQETIPPFPVTDWTYKPNEHGPFAPNIKGRW